MAVYDIGAIRAALKALLTSVSSVQNVYDYRNSAIDGYPSVLFDLDNEDGQMLDDANNQRIITFKLWVVTEIPVDGLQAAKDLLDSVTKDVINVLEKKSNQTLSNTCDWLMPVIGRRDQSTSPEGNFFYQELNLKVYVTSSIL